MGQSFVQGRPEVFWDPGIACAMGMPFEANTVVSQVEMLRGLIVQHNCSQESLSLRNSLHGWLPRNETHLRPPFVLLFN